MLPEDVAHCFYRIAQEASENVLRHAGAKNVSVSLIPEGDSAVFVFKDDGKGFDTGALKNEHLGMRGMRERVEMLDGEFSVKSTKKQGTEITAKLFREGA